MQNLLKNLSIFFISLSLCLFAFFFSTRTTTPAVAIDHQIKHSPASRSPEEQKTIDVYKEVNEAVVFIATETLEVDPLDWFSEFKNNKGSGTGVVIDSEESLVLTNFHVINGANKIQILLGNSTAYQAKLLGVDEEYDLALLKILDAPKLKEVKFGDSSALEVGQRVLAIGNPFGLNRTLTKGIISSLDRTVQGANSSLMRGMIQTDAAINPGNSGGPLLDSDGRVIGINTAILSASGDSAGIGFAIPINAILSYLPELISTGRVRRPTIGWILLDTNQGPFIRRVMANSPAAAAEINTVERLVSNGIVRGYVRDFEHADLIVSVNGAPVNSSSQVNQIVRDSKPGEKVTFELRIGGVRGRSRFVEIEPELK